MVQWGALLVLAMATTAIPAKDKPGVTAKIDMVSLLVPRGQQQPFLGDGGWIIDGQRTNTPKQALLARARSSRNWVGSDPKNAAIIVSLGAKPTLGSFLRTARSLRQMNLCLVFVKEGGEEAGSIDGEAVVEVTGLRLC